MAPKGDKVIPADEAPAESCAPSSETDRRGVIGEQAVKDVSVLSELSRGMFRTSDQGGDIGERGVAVVGAVLL